MAEQRKGELFPGFSYGNVMVLAAMGVSIALGWGRLETGLAHHDRRIQELEDAGDRLMTERMREARDVADIKADMRWIRLSLERLEGEFKGRN